MDWRNDDHYRVYMRLNKYGSSRGLEKRRSLPRLHASEQVWIQPDTGETTIVVAAGTRLNNINQVG